MNEDVILLAESIIDIFKKKNASQPISQEKRLKVLSEGFAI